MKLEEVTPTKKKVEAVQKRMATLGKRCTFVEKELEKRKKIDKTYELAREFITKFDSGATPMMFIIQDAIFQFDQNKDVVIKDQSKEIKDKATEIENLKAQNFLFMDLYRMNQI